MAHYYKILNENGDPIGIYVNSGGPHPDPVPDGYVEITYEEYVEVCELLGIYPR